MVISQQAITDSVYNRLATNLKLAEKSGGQLEIARSTCHLADYYYESGLYTQAIGYYNRALLVANDLIKDSIHVALNNKLGRVYLSSNNYESAHYYFKEALAIAQSKENISGEALSKSYLGAYYEKQGDYLNALLFENESLQSYELINDTIGIARVNGNMGSIYEDLLQFDKAYDYFSKSYAVFKDSGTKEEVNLLNNLGDVYRKRGEIETSIIYTNQALDLSLLLKDNNLIKSAYKDLSKAYANLGDYKHAYANRELAETYVQQALIDQNLGQIIALQADYDAKSKAAEIKALTRQNEVNRSNQRLMIIAFSAVLGLLATLGFYFYKKRKSTTDMHLYKQLMMKAELDKKAIEEKDLQRAVELKTAALAKYSLHVAQKNKILEQVSRKLKDASKRSDLNLPSKINEIAKGIDFNLKQESEWQEFNRIFNEVHPDFIVRLSSVSDQKLSPAELKLGILLRLNMSSKEIASVLRVTPDSVRVARYRLRKKLPINPQAELVNFMLEL